MAELTSSRQHPSFCPGCETGTLSRAASWGLPGAGRSPLQRGGWAKTVLLGLGRGLGWNRTRAGSRMDGGGSCPAWRLQNRSCSQIYSQRGHSACGATAQSAAQSPCLSKAATPVSEPQLGWRRPWWVQGTCSPEQ